MSCGHGARGNGRLVDVRFRHQRRPRLLRKRNRLGFGHSPSDRDGGGSGPSSRFTASPLLRHGAIHNRMDHPIGKPRGCHYANLPQLLKRVERERRRFLQLLSVTRSRNHNLGVTRTIHAFRRSGALGGAVRRGAPRALELGALPSVLFWSGAFLSCSCGTTTHSLRYLFHDG